MLSRTTALPASALRHSVVRASLRASAATSSASLISRSATTHAISNPTLANIEKRWDDMPMQEQADLWMSLRDRMKGNWAELTFQEKKAAYYIAFGNHGPRALPPPGEGKQVALYTFYGVAASFVVFCIMRYFARPAPHTMNKEWQEATNEYLKNQRANPFTGVSAEGYTGQGAIQSPPKRA